MPVILLVETLSVLREIGLLTPSSQFDGNFRAFDKLTAKLLWETMLSAAGSVTPATFKVKGQPDTLSSPEAEEETLQRRGVAFVLQPTEH